jgi:hypothetical protein
LDETAKVMGLTRDAVRNKEMAAWKKIRNSENFKKFKSLFYNNNND